MQKLKLTCLLMNQKRVFPVRSLDRDGQPVAATWTVAKSEENGQQKIDRPFVAATLVTLVSLSGFYGSTGMEWLFVH